MILTSTLNVQSGACERVNSCEQVSLWSVRVKSDGREAERHFCAEIDLAFPTDTTLKTKQRPNINAISFYFGKAEPILVSDLQKGV